jgi:hypothetical protein
MSNLSPGALLWEQCCNQAIQEIYFVKVSTIKKSVRALLCWNIWFRQNEKFDHAGDRLTRRSQTWVLIFVNSAPIFWFSKRQDTVETSLKDYASN